MYNLIVTAHDGAWDESYFTLDQSRFLEHTEDQVKERIADLNDAVVAELTRLPTVFAYETSVDRSARVGRIRTIRNRQGEIRITFEFDSRILPLTPQELTAHAWDFDLNRFEMNRTHWAVKDVDLLEALDETGLARGVTDTSPGDAHFSRRTIIAAATLLKNVGHTSFDHMLLEFGVAGLSAGRDLGGLLARSTALAEFAINNPSALTAEGDSIGNAVVRRAIPNLGLEDGGEALRQALEQDGFVVSDGRIVRTAETSGPRMPYDRGRGQGDRDSVNVPQVSSVSRSDRTVPYTINPTQFRLPDGDVQADLVAIMMPFDPEFGEVYDAIKAAGEIVSLDCKRVDDIWEDSTIINDVFSLIYRSRIVVVDLTGQNPKVLYETCIAHTLGKPVVPITQSETDVPFDLRQHRHLRYLNNGEGRQNLTTKLASRVRKLAAN